MLPRSRRANPENVDIGDTVKFTYIHKDALISVQGTVYRRIDDGNIRKYYTQEGIMLMYWEPGKGRGSFVEMVHKAETEQATLFELPGNINERIG